MLNFVHGLNNKVGRCSGMLIDMNYMKHNKISDEIVEKIIVPYSSEAKQLYMYM